MSEWQRATLRARALQAEEETRRLEEAIHNMMKAAARGRVPDDVYDVMVRIRNAALRGEEGVR